MSEKSPRIYKTLIMILPIGVVIGTIVFMVMYFRNAQEEKKETSIIAAHGLRYQDLDDMVTKFTDLIGERDVDTEQGREGLQRAAAMIEGRLGPQNVGLNVTRGEGEAKHGRLWKSRWVDLLGQKSPEEILIVATSYSGAGEVADANRVSALSIVTISAAREKPDRTVRFVFLPFELSPAEQENWITKNCIAEDETCIGIIGLQQLKGSPEKMTVEWATNSTATDGWMDYMMGKNSTRPTGSPTVWLSHTVFSNQAWIGLRKERLERTLELAADLRRWILRAAES